EEPLNIVHLDISPTNLLVTEDGFLKIIDFGIAQARGQAGRGDGVLPGKLSYMSPEQATRGAVDHRSDIFSLGIVLYEITVGRRLFKGTPQDVVDRLTSGKVEPPTFARDGFPPALEGVVMRALERHPEDRYQSAYDLADELEAFLREARATTGPVRIARYLDELADASGGQRRPELVAEADRERAAAGEELDFDSQVFGGLSPAAGVDEAAGPAWEDLDEPEAEVAAALGVELEELRALRTPMPSLPPVGEASREAPEEDEPPPPRALPLPPDDVVDPEAGVSTIPVTRLPAPRQAPDAAAPPTAPSTAPPPAATGAPWALVVALGLALAALLAYVAVA
ncbi:MAG: serine/threonine-protein kinase, partial [Kofleriaceae bacterium]